MFDFYHMWLLHSYNSLGFSDLQVVAYLRDSAWLGMTFPWSLEIKFKIPNK